MRCGVCVSAYYESDRATIYHGDCRDIMEGQLPDNWVDSIVTDPPYELGFMGKGWDGSGIAYNCEVWENAYRILKPGGHLLAFGGTRTWHRLAVAIEDAGFEVRDSIAWMYGSGFPKSLDVSKAIDKRGGTSAEFASFRDDVKEAMQRNSVTRSALQGALGNFMLSHYLTAGSQPAVPNLRDYQIIRDTAGLGDKWDAAFNAEAEREVVGSKNSGLDKGSGASVDFQGSKGRNIDGLIDITAPATPAAQQWQGWGTALKPAFEPIVVARKPLIGTVAENVLAHGTGALNIDGCRIGTKGGGTNCTNRDAAGHCNGHDNAGRSTSGETVHGPETSAGRWPANVILDESQAAELDAQSGVTISTPFKRKDGPATFGGTFGNDKPVDSDAMYNDTGGASRFFYCPKAGKKERPNVDGVAHPTVKPLKLMEYLCRLVTPPGGTILEPFAGSGTTIEAALNEGFNVIGIEMTDEYLPLIMARIERHGEKLC